MSADDPLTKREEEFRRMLLQPARRAKFAAELRTDWMERQPPEARAALAQLGLGVEVPLEDGYGS